MLCIAVLFTLDPHATTPHARTAKSAANPHIVRKRLRAGTKKSSKQASAVPPRKYRCPAARAGNATAALLAAVLNTVRVDVAALTPVICAGLVEPKLKVGVSRAPMGLAVMATVSATAPVNPPLGVMLIVEAFPVSAPGEIVTAVPVTVKVGAGPPMV